MKVVALISGGKDSTFNMMQCIAAGHDIVALANLSPEDQTEIDSYMYQSVGHEAIDYIAQALDLPLFKKYTKGISYQTSKSYEMINNDDEVEDLFKLLCDIKEKIEFDAVSVGAILSDYQRLRVENVCVRLDLIPLAYLWQRNQKELLDQMIKCNVEAIIIKVAALGLNPKQHLGHSISQMQPHLYSMHEKYGLNICGEGGEYETLTLDCPLFKSKLKIKESEIILHSNDPIAPVGYIKLNKLILEEKNPLVLEMEFLNILSSKNNDIFTSGCYDNFQYTEEVISNICNLQNYQNPTSLEGTRGWLWIGGIYECSTDAKTSMEKALNNLKSILLCHNHTLRNIYSVSLFVSDIRKFNEYNQIYHNYFNHINPPSRACVEVPLPEYSVIIYALSWKQPTIVNDETLIERQIMHVQSRSYWAPANIGPYSQAVQISDFIYLSGQIGLVPETLQLVKGGLKLQCQLTLRHIHRLLKAIDNNVNLSNVVQGICYIVDLSFVDCVRNLWEEKTNNAIINYIVVKRLPKDALVEWHVWAHKHNGQFEYEETGKYVNNYLISMYKRWNYENNIAAIVCYVENNCDSQLTKEIFIEIIHYTLEKLKINQKNENDLLFNFNIFYCTKKIHDFIITDYLKELTKTINLVYTIVPVAYVKNKDTYFSVTGIRH